MKEDKELYKEFLEGNNEALNELMEKYKIELIYFVQKYVKDYHAAEDVSQEVFIYLMKHREVYDFKYTFRTYLYMIAKSRALNHIKVRRRVFFLEDNSPEKLYNEYEDVEEEIFRNDEGSRVRRAMKKLKDEYQLVLYLTEFKGLTYKESGIVMKKSIAQIKALVHNAKKRLKFFLEEEMKEEVEHDEINGRIH